MHALKWSTAHTPNLDCDGRIRDLTPFSKHVKCECKTEKFIFTNSFFVIVKKGLDLILLKCEQTGKWPLQLHLIESSRTGLNLVILKRNYTKLQHQVKVHHNTTFFKIITICQVTKDKNSSIVCLCRCSAMRNIIRYIVIMIEKLNLLSCRAWVSISWTCFGAAKSWWR